MVYEQLTSYCPCLCMGSDEELNKRNIDELINLISVATCWTQRPCETFLMEERREVIDLPDCMDDCELFEFDPFYHPFLLNDDGDPADFTFTLVEQRGTEETEIEITDYIYSMTDEIFKLNLPIPSCKCGCDPCGCPTHYKLVVTYTAGYHEIPDCLLPLFCEALKIVIDKNKCDCEECQECAKKYGEYTVNYDEADSLKLRLTGYFIDTLTKQYINQLGLISLCSDKRKRYWGFVV